MSGATYVQGRPPAPFWSTAMKKSAVLNGGSQLPQKPIVNSPSTATPIETSLSEICRPEGNVREQTSGRRTEPPRARR